jgi:hypothetical protein
MSFLRRLGVNLWRTFLLCRALAVLTLRIGTWKKGFVEVALRSDREHGLQMPTVCEGRSNQGSTAAHFL